ncbi:ANTAR domain-containing protein [Actinomycetota bacterium Odt1-20B]
MTVVAPPLALTEAAVLLMDQLLDEAVAEEDVLQGWAEWCTGQFAVREAGVLLADGEGRLHVAAATASDVHALQSLAATSGEGPGPGCFVSGSPVLLRDLRSAADRWPHYVRRADAMGIAAVGSVPLRRRAFGPVLGALNLFASEVNKPSEDGVGAAQTLAEAVAVALTKRRALEDSRRTIGQLEHALTSRIRIEQAKGMLAERWRTDADAAFDRLRRYARGQRVCLDEVCQAVTSRDPDKDPFAF